MLEPEQMGKLMKILWEDCSAVDWKDGEVDYNVLPPLLEFLDIDGKVIGRESAGRICSASMVKMGNTVLQDLVLPDKQYHELNELLKAPAQEVRQSIHVWRADGKAEFEYRGVRYVSLEQLKKQADLTNGFIVHLMRKTVKDDILRLYRDLQGLGFKV